MRKYACIKIVFLCLSIALLLSGEVFGDSPYSSVLSDAPDWREKLEAAIARKLISDNARTLLYNHVSDNHEVVNIIESIKSGDDQAALRSVRGLTIEAGSAEVPDEVMFVAGLIYEYFGFFPEAYGNYSRVIQFYKDGAYYRKTLLRMTFINLGRALLEDAKHLLKETNDKFYRVYRESKDTIEWKDALAGYAIGLHGLKDYKYADEVFGKISGYLPTNPLYLFVYAENLAHVGKPKEAEAAFRKVSEMYSEGLFLSYVMLRLGDAAVIDGREKDGEGIYMQLVESAENKSDVEAGDPRIFGSLASVELHLKQQKTMEAVSTLRALLKLTMFHQVRPVVMFYLAGLYKAGNRHEEAAELSRQALPASGLLKFDNAARRMLIESVEVLIREAFEAGDYKKVSGLYFENKIFIKDKELLLMAAESLLQTNMPEDARKIYGAMKFENTFRINIGLVRSMLAQGEQKAAEEMLKTIMPANKDEQTVIARLFLAAGDSRLKNSEYAEAQILYDLAQKGIDDPALRLKQAQIYQKMGDNKKALTVYREYINSITDAGIKNTILLRIGDIYYANKERKEALEAYKKGAGSGDKAERTWALYRIGDIQYSFGNEKDAIEAWQKVAAEDEGYLRRLAEARLKEAGLWKSVRM